jgi:hypothetical protein
MTTIPELSRERVQAFGGNDGRHKGQFGPEPSQLRITAGIKVGANLYAVERFRAGPWVM